jgi:hypothetical protein
MTLPGLNPEACPAKASAGPVGESCRDGRRSPWLRLAPLARSAATPRDACRSPRPSNAGYGPLREGLPDAGAWRGWLLAPAARTPTLPHFPYTTDWISAAEVSKKFHILSVLHIYSFSSKNFVVVVTDLIIASRKNTIDAAAFTILVGCPWSVEQIREYYYHIFQCIHNSGCNFLIDSEHSTALNAVDVALRSGEWSHFRGFLRVLSADLVIRAMNPPVMVRFRGQSCCMQKVNDHVKCLFFLVARYASVEMFCMSWELLHLKHY